MSLLDTEDADSFWPKFNQLDSTLHRVMRTTPPISSHLGFLEPECTNSVLLNPCVYFRNVTSYVTIITLRTVLDRRGVPQSFEKALKAAIQIADLTQTIRTAFEDGSFHPIYMDTTLFVSSMARFIEIVYSFTLFFQPHFCTAAMVLIREMRSMHEGAASVLDSENRFRSIFESLEALLDTIADFCKYYPRLRECCRLLNLLCCIEPWILSVTEVNDLKRNIVQADGEAYINHPPLAGSQSSWFSQSSSSTQK
jgi:hypothetical protein